MLTDFRLAWRALRTAPAYALTAICCLALGLGANAAVLQVADAIFFRPPAGVRDVGHLRRVGVERSMANTPPGFPPGFTLVGASRADLAQAPAAHPAVLAVAGYEPRSVPVGRGSRVEDAHAEFVAPGYFATLGVTLERGRGFAPDEERGAGSPVAVLSHRYWMSHFGGDPRVLGRPVIVYDRPVTVVGVMSRAFTGVDLTPPVDLWFPLEQAARIRGEPDEADARQRIELQLIARVTEGTPPEVAAAALARAFARVPEGTGPMHFARPTVQVGPLRLGDDERNRVSGQLARWLAAVSALVLVVACTSVAGLALARGVARQRELAVRLALGAGRTRLVRQLATEAVLLTGGGALAATGVWTALAALLRRFPVLPAPPPLDAWRLAPAVLAALVVVIVACGVLPALAATRGGLRAALHTAGGAAAGTSVGRARGREALLVAQIAVTLVLVTGAGLFLRSLSNALHADFGFDVEHTLLLSAGPRRSLGDVVTGDAAARLRDRAAALPWVRDAAFMAPAPFTGFLFAEVEVPGAVRARSAPLQTQMVMVDEHFLPTFGVRLVRGRGFTAADRPDPMRQGSPNVADPRVVLVNEAMARRDWPGQNPVGRCVRFRSNAPDARGALGGCVTVVGVVADMRALGLNGAPPAAVYEPLGPDPGGFSSLVVRLRAPADARRAERVRAALAASLPNVPRFTAMPLAELLDPEIAPHRLGAALFSVYGALALVLAAVGLHGVVRYNAERRGRELAVRTALGARPVDLVRLVAGRGARLALIGAALGLTLALAASHLVSGLLYQVQPADPLAVAGACAMLGAVALLASWLPARRASRVDPAAALRSE